VAAVIATAGIGSGAREKIQNALERPETRVVTLGIFTPRNAGQSTRHGFSTKERLEPADYYAIQSSIGEAIATPRVYVPTIHVTAGGKFADAVLEGLDSRGFTIFSSKLLDGEFFDELAVRRALNVCVISRSLASRLFPQKNPIGQTIAISGSAFFISGIVEDALTSQLSAFTGFDYHVYTPFTSLLRRIDRSAQMSIVVQVPDVAGVGRIQSAMSDVMEQRRRGRTATFLTTNAFESVKAYADGSIAVGRLLAIVGAIALIIGGIGIMNIMIVSVTERTREIGIRLALGTRRADLLLQFLAESVILSMLGGLFGTIVGTAAAKITTYLNDWPTHVSGSALVGALLSSAAVGLFFGYQPAKKAAELVPVCALRAE
jgi:putative ABC transport system permease protein